MSEHELWNELGNLYFISGTYSQAAYAYNRSIQLDSGFGRPYCNLALTYVKQGRYVEAVRLYERSIDLLVDDREKAVTWYRLGDVYRHLKDYRDAIMAYQQADLLDPGLNLDRKESGQILYGGSEGAEKQVPPTAAIPAPAPLRDEPVAAIQDVQVPDPVAESPADEVIAILPQEPRIAAIQPELVLEEPVVEEPLMLAQNEETQVTPSAEKLPVVESASFSEDPVPWDAPPEIGLPFDGTAAPLPDEPVEVLTVLSEQLVEDASPLPREDEPVIAEATPILPAGIPALILIEQAENPIAASMAEVLPVESMLPAAALEEAPAMQEEIEPAILPEPEPASLTEDPSAEFITMVAASQLQDNLTSEVEAVSDLTGAGGDEEEYPYKDFEHETQVFVPDSREEALDHWLPITTAETFSSEAASASDYAQNLEPSAPEAAYYTGAIQPDPQYSPLALQRYVVETSPTASQDVDVIVQDEYAQPLFIIPEGTDLVAPEAQDESGQAYPSAATLPGEEDEELKETEREIERFQQVVQHNPRNASAWDTLGTLYKYARRYRDAILAYQQAVVADPSKAPYHHHLGIIYAVEGRDEDAIRAFQEVIEIDPNHSLAHASLGGYYRRMGLEELAQKHIGRAMKNFYNSENEYNRACMEALCGHTEQSIELLRVALMNKQTYVDWVLRDPDLDSIRRDPRFKQLISDYTA